MNRQNYASGAVGMQQLRGGARSRRPVGTLPFRYLRRAAVPVGVRPATRWTGQICPIVLTDITAFSAHRRSDEDRLILRRTMYDMLQRAFEAAGLMWRELHTEDRGDGTLIVVPPDTPASAVAARALGHLAAALRWHNQSASDALRMQLRVALHAGRPQRYGTQMRCIAGGWRPVPPVEEPAQLNTRRGWVGLAPIAAAEKAGARLCGG